LFDRLQAGFSIAMINVGLLLIVFVVTMGRERVPSPIILAQASKAQATPSQERVVWTGLHHCDEFLVRLHAIKAVSSPMIIMDKNADFAEFIDCIDRPLTNFDRVRILVSQSQTK